MLVEIKNPFDVQLGEHIDSAESAEQPEVAFVNCSFSAIDRWRREHAVAFALASVGLEGLSPSAEMRALACRFVNGEIDLTRFMSVDLDCDAFAGAAK